MPENANVHQAQGSRLRSGNSAKNQYAEPYRQQRSSEGHAVVKHEVHHTNVCRSRESVRIESERVDILRQEVSGA